MTDKMAHQYLYDLSSRYRIRVWGALDEPWISQIDGLDIKITRSKNQPPVTCITGMLADQAALAGLLTFLNELGMVIISVRRLNIPEQQDLRASSSSH